MRKIAIPALRNALHYVIQHGPAEVYRAGRTVLTQSPLRTLTQGWGAMSPAHDLQLLAKLKTGGKWEQFTKKFPLRAKNMEELAAHAAPHLRESPGSSKVRNLRSLAENLSRRGWTGAGKTTKYLPVGMKGQVAAFTALGANKALQGSPEHVGESVGDTAGWIAGAPFGLMGMLATGATGRYLGRQTGHVLGSLRRKVKE